MNYHIQYHIMPGIIQERSNLAKIQTNKQDKIRILLAGLVPAMY